MTYLHRLLARIVSDLHRSGTGFALVGGIAVSARVEARFTRDLDLAVAVADDAEAERLVASLKQDGYLLEALLEHERVGRIATARLRPPQEIGPSAFVDLLFASSGIESEVVSEATPADLPGAPAVRVARIGHLVALKLLAEDEDRRPQDRVDIANLMRAANRGELELARTAVRQIEARGFARGRDLSIALEVWIESRP